MTRGKQNVRTAVPNHPNLANEEMPGLHMQHSTCSMRIRTYIHIPNTQPSIASYQGGPDLDALIRLGLGAELSPYAPGFLPPSSPRPSHAAAQSLASERLTLWLLLLPLLLLLLLLRCKLASLPSLPHFRLLSLGLVFCKHPR